MCRKFLFAQGIIAVTASSPLLKLSHLQVWDACLDLGEALGELLPVVHNSSGLALLLQQLGHLLHLLLALLNAVDADIRDQWDASTHGSSSTRLGVLDGDAALVLDTELLAGVVVDLGVWLGGWWVERSGGGVDVLIWEVVVDANLLDRGNDTWLSRGGDNRHLVALVLDPLHHLWHAWAWLALLGQLSGDGTKLTVDVGIDLLWAHLEVVDLLQLVAHAAEVLANERLEQLVHIVLVVDVVLLENLVAEVGASLEGEELGLGERVVAVEENVVDLCILSEQ